MLNLARKVSFAVKTREAHLMVDPQSSCRAHHEKHLQTLDGNHTLALREVCLPIPTPYHSVQREQEGKEKDKRSTYLPGTHYTEQEQMQRKLRRSLGAGRRRTQFRRRRTERPKLRRLRRRRSSGCTCKQPRKRRPLDQAISFLHTLVAGLGNGYDMNTTCAAAM